MVAVALSAGCTVPTEPWEPAQESPEAAQARQKARLQVEKPRWIFVETQFLEWGMLPPDPVKPLLGGDDFNAGERPRPQQTLLQEEENPEIDPPKEWGQSQPAAVVCLCAEARGAGALEPLPDRLVNA